MYKILMFGTAQAALIRGMSLFQECLKIRGVFISYFRSVLISGLSLFQGCPNFKGYLRDVLISMVQGMYKMPPV